MAGDVQDAVWPLPKFYFEVSWDDTTISFQEVSGLDAESTPIEYRHGDSGTWSPIKMPGLKKYGNVTMKRGVFVSDNSYFDWFSEIKLNTIARKTVTVHLLDESGSPTMKWTLNNAFPTKVTSTDMKSDGNEAAIDSLEIAYETLVIENS